MPGCRWVASHCAVVASVRWGDGARCRSRAVGAQCLANWQRCAVWSAWRYDAALVRCLVTQVDFCWRLGRARLALPLAFVQRQPLARRRKYTLAITGIASISALAGFCAVYPWTNKRGVVIEPRALGALRAIFVLNRQAAPTAKLLCHTIVAICLRRTVPSAGSHNGCGEDGTNAAKDCDAKMLHCRRYCLFLLVHGNKGVLKVVHGHTTQYFIKIRAREQSNSKSIRSIFDSYSMKRSISCQNATPSRRRSLPNLNR